MWNNKKNGFHLETVFFTYVERMRIELTTS